jgi:hypothetical protein
VRREHAEADLFVFTFPGQNGQRATELLEARIHQLLAEHKCGLALQAVVRWLCRKWEKLPSGHTELRSIPDTAAVCLLECLDAAKRMYDSGIEIIDFDLNTLAAGQEAPANSVDVIFRPLQLLLVANSAPEPDLTQLLEVFDTCGEQMHFGKHFSQILEAKKELQKGVFGLFPQGAILEVYEKLVERRQRALKRQGEKASAAAKAGELSAGRLLIAEVDAKPGAAAAKAKKRIDVPRLPRASCGAAMPRCSAGAPEPRFSYGAPMPRFSCGAPLPRTSAVASMLRISISSGAPEPRCSYGAPMPRASSGAPMPRMSCGAPLPRASAGAAFVRRPVAVLSAAHFALA